MANVKISDLNSLAEGDIVTSTDVVPIVDASAGETKKSTSQAVVNAGLKAPGPIGGTTPDAGTFTSLVSTSLLGYATGVGTGGTVTQGSWNANVTLNKVCGTITLYNSVGDLTPFGAYGFIVYNSTVSNSDNVILTQLTGNDQKISYSVGGVTDGAFVISITCLSAAPVAGVSLAFAVFNNATS